MKRFLSVGLALLLLCALPACAASNNRGELGDGLSSVSAQDTGPNIPAEPRAPGEIPAQQSGAPYDGVYPRHEPYGKGVGAMPGRVSWVHDTDSVDWDGSGYWWSTGNYNEAAILQMVRDGVASLGGQDDVRAGWDALFAAHNGGAGYAAGQRIAIKANINGSAVYDDDTSGKTQMSYTNPVLLKALLLSLVEDAGVTPSDITVYDVSRLFPDYMVEMCTQGSLSGVRFVGRNNGVADEAAPIRWSHAFSGKVNYLPTCVMEAEYVINLANLKGHSYGVTLCGKNHFGSFINGNAMRPPEGANLHQWLTMNEMGVYSPLVDLMANEQLGGKTVLYMLDALICAVSEGSSMSGDNTKWQQAPFSGDYTQSIFLSQDPVAIDSVGADFLMNEPTVTEHNGAIRNNPNVENYLHEAGLVGSAPSTTAYQNGSGTAVTNLGVHEHWNNTAEKRYGRNLGRDEGIELLRVGAPSGQAAAPEESTDILVAWFSATGNTKGVAEQIAARLNADSYEIVPEIPYTRADLDYSDSGSRTSIEQSDMRARPAISGSVPDMERYDTVFIGYPIWFGQAPRIISTFLESCDLSGKTVVPFCTSGSSGVGSSDRNLHALAEDANWMEGRRFAANAANGEITAWADGFFERNTLHIRLGDTLLTATLHDNSSAEALKALLAGGPMTVEMHDYGGFEKVGELGAELPRNDESITTEAGDLILYLGTRFVIYYGTNTWDLTRLGKINDVSAQELRAILGSGDVRAVLSIAEG